MAKIRAVIDFAHAFASTSREFARNLPRMETENKHNTLMTEIILTAFRVKLNILESRLFPYILTDQDYANLQVIKTLIAETEELDTLPSKK